MTGTADDASVTPLLHRTLLRQLRKLRLDLTHSPAPDVWPRLLDVVSTSYQEADNDRYTLERSIELSSAEMRALHDVLSAQARQDSLTGLPNRTAVLEHLRRELARSRRAHSDVAVLFIDLDGFKLVNDTLGHEAGDHLLVRAAERIRSAVRTEDTVARLGGDEFVVVCGGIEAAERERGPSLVAGRIVELLEAPFRIGTQDVFVSASIGISMTTFASRTPDPSAEDLLRQADQAMYRAKGAGRANFAIYDAQMAAEAGARMALEADLRRAVANDELVLHYQPLMDLASGGVTGFEALVRWNRPGFGLVPPNVFIPIAEEARLIHAIGRWVLDEACRTAATWAAELSISVNLSARELGHPDIVNHVSDALHDSGLAPQRLVVELTESTALSDREGVATNIGRLRSLGVRVAIDDFGTGYSSLGRLRSLEAQILKIDRSFVNDLDQGEGAVAIIAAVVAMGRSLGLQVVAEGVETLGQLETLERLGCEGAQGYHFAKPLAPADLAAFLATARFVGDVAPRFRVA